MKRLVLVVLLLFVAIPTYAACPDSCEIFWSAVTTYTDGSAIESQDLPLSYAVEYDGSVIGITQNLTTLVPKPYGHNVEHTIKVKAITKGGTEGEYSDPFVWNSPKGIPAKVGPGIGVR